MAQDTSKIAVVYIADRNYHLLTLYSLASFARAHCEPLDFYFMQSDYSEPVPLACQQLVESCNHNLMVMEAPLLAPSYAIRDVGHVTKATFLKVAAVEVFVEKYKYILYVDGDILALGDPHLYSFANFSETVAACLDLSNATGFDDPTFFANCKASNFSTHYFNAGVIFINAKRWVETRVGQRFADSLERHATRCPYFRACAPNDQCALNMTLSGDSKLLPTRFNVQKSALHTSAWTNATLRHYTGRKKFLPMRMWRCDQREHALLCLLNRKLALGSALGLYDGGISYAFNKVRRRKFVAKCKRAISLIEVGQTAKLSQELLV